MPPTSPNRMTLRRSVALVWRTLRSMRTALVLLLLLALAQVPGSLLPQIPNSPERVSAYLRDHPFWGDLFLRAGLFDVFGSWWFSLIVVLLFTSLVACLIPRSRAMVRGIRQRPVQAREIDAFPLYVERPIAAEPDDVVASARRVLRRRGFRVEVDPGARSVAAEKGALREGGSLVFHWAFVLLLLAAVIGKGTGYSGRATLAEGQTWVDATANYDGTLRAGRFFAGNHSGAGLHLVSFEDRYRDTGVPMDFVSTVQLLDPDGNVVGTEEVRVNHPVSFDGLRIFQFGFGWAPVVRVAEDGTTISGGPLIMGQDTAPAGVSQLAVPWRGFIKLPTTKPQTAIELELIPDSGAYLQTLRTGVPQPMIVENAPFMRYTVWRGPLFDLSKGSLDTSLMKRTGRGVIGAAQTVDLERGCVVADASSPSGVTPGAACPPGVRPSLTMSFPDLRRYSVFQVSHDAGVPFAFAAAILILLGLLPALYTSRRKLWVRAEPGDGGTVLKVGGFALQRKSQYEEEFSKVVDALVEAAGGPRRRTEEMVGSS